MSKVSLYFRWRTVVYVGQNKEHRWWLDVSKTSNGFKVLASALVALVLPLCFIIFLRCVDTTLLEWLSDFHFHISLFCMFFDGYIYCSVFAAMLPFLTSHSLHSSLFPSLSILTLCIMMLIVDVFMSLSHPPRMW